MKDVNRWAEEVINEVEKVFFGKREVIQKLLVALLCRGHVLLEDVPGVGKTILAKAVAKTLGGEFSRIQCTPDLLPADILGHSVYNPKEGTFLFKKGPIQSNIVLVDEINRATPRTQSALLEAMAENQISIEGKSENLPEPFFIMATENPIEFEGTYPLPEAQKDRFLFSLNVGYPDREKEKLILESQRRLSHPVNDLVSVSAIGKLLEIQEKIVLVYVDPKTADYILEIITRTRTSAHLQLGASPRGSLALYKSSQALAALNGRDYVVPEDVQQIAIPVLSKRVILKPEAAYKGYTTNQVLKDILESIPFPVIGERHEV